MKPMIFKHHKPKRREVYGFFRYQHGRRKAFWLAYRGPIYTILGCCMIVFGVILGQEYVGAWGWGIAVALLGGIFVHKGAVSEP